MRSNAHKEIIIFNKSHMFRSTVSLEAQDIWIQELFILFSLLWNNLQKVQELGVSHYILDKLNIVLFFHVADK